MNPTAVMPDGTPNKFEKWYADEVARDPSFTREEALKEWDDRYNLNKKEKVVRPVPGYTGANKAGRPTRTNTATYPSTTGNFSNKAGR